MQLKRRMLLTTDHGFNTSLKGCDLGCDNCGGLCREIVELLSPEERGTLISNFKAERRAQTKSGELLRLVTGSAS